MTKRISTIIATLAFMFLGCSSSTDFDGPGKIDIGEETGDMVTVTLDGDLATVALEFASELPVEQADAVYDLIGSTVNLVVSNEATGVNAELLENIPVEETPAAPGEYMVEVAEDNMTVTITLYNESLEGAPLRADGDYAALLDVAENDWFVTDSLVYDVEVVDAK